MAKENKILLCERKRWLFFGIPWTFTKYTVDEKKILINSGFFKSIEDEILLYRIMDMSLSRTLLQKIFRLGTITIYSQDKTSPILTIKNIKNVNNFKNVLSEAVENDKIRLRVRRSEIMDADVAEGFSQNDSSIGYSDSYDDSYLL